MEERDGWEEGADMSDLQERVLVLEKALTDLYSLVDSGWLVRDISHDHEDGWGMKQLRPVMILKEVAALVEGTKTLDKKK